MSTTSIDKKRKVPGEWATLYADSSTNCSEAINLLHEAGYFVIRFESEGTIEPELVIGREEFKGLNQIRRALGT